MAEITDVWQGTLALMVMKTLQMMGPLHGYGIARRIEQVSGSRVSVKYGTLYPALLKLEQEGYVAAHWGLSDNNRRAKFYRLTKAGQRQLGEETALWNRIAVAIAQAPPKPGVRSADMMIAEEVRKRTLTTTANAAVP